MTKTLTKEQLAALLDGGEYRAGISKEIGKTAKENNLVIITGASDDLIELHGAIHEEIGATVNIFLTRKGVPVSDCDEGDDCPYFKKWKTTALKQGSIKEIEVYWDGECGRKTLSPEEYAALGKPTWCFKTTLPHAVFSMYDTEGDDRDFFCRGMVIDLDEVFPPLNYTSMMMNEGGWES